MRFRAIRARTTIKPLRACRTTTVQGRAWRRRIVLLMPLVCGAVSAEDPREPSIGAQERTEARGWLQLESDQRTYRERAGPLTPPENAKLEQLERRQELQLRGLQLEQRRNLQGERRESRTASPERHVPVESEIEDKRGLSRERLDMRIQREILRGGRP